VNSRTAFNSSSSANQPQPTDNGRQTRRKIPHKVINIPDNFGAVPPNKDDPSSDAEQLPGTAGVDYPNYWQVPSTAFNCRAHESSGMYADVETGCQAFHNCDPQGHKMSFLCPNGTIFKQELFICDWWYNVNCQEATNFYHLNTNKYPTRRPNVRRPTTPQK